MDFSCDGRCSAEQCDSSLHVCQHDILWRKAGPSVSLPGRSTYNGRPDVYNGIAVMSKKNSSSKAGSSTIALNKKARHEYFIEDKYEAGLELQGWEVKSLRAGKANISESYVVVRNGQVYLFGATIIPLSLASTHVVCDPTRTRKLLLNKREIERLIGLVERQGYTLIPLAMYWTRAWVKLEIGLAKGKKEHDKRSDLKEREWARDKERMMKNKAR